MSSAFSSRPILASRLVTAAACGRADAYYRLARIVARVLVSVKLRQREKWLSLARQLAVAHGVEDRLVLQAIGWLRHPVFSTMKERSAHE